MAEILSAQYAGVFSKPVCDINDSHFIEELMAEEDSGKPVLKDVFIDKEFIRKILK